MKNVHPVYGAGIQTHNLWNMSLLPWPLDQGSRPSFQKLAQYSYIGPNPGWDIWGVFGSGDWKFAYPLPRVHIDYRTKLEGFEATYLQTAAATFWATFGNIWATFYFNIWSHLLLGGVILNERPNQCDQKKSPNVYKNCPRMISLEKWWIFDTFTKIAFECGRIGQINCCLRL